MNEKTYRKKIHALLPPNVYYQSMTNTPVGGTPDFYYEAPKERILWVEWKWTNSKRPKKPPAVTNLQDIWLTRAYINNVKAAVIEGCPSGGFIFQGVDWRLKEARVDDPFTNEEVANWICFILKVKHQ